MSSTSSSSNNEEESKEKTARKAKTSELEDNAPTEKIGQGEYASVKDSPKGNQLRNTDKVVGSA